MLVLRTRILNMINSTYKACAAVLYIRCDRVGKPSEGEWSNMDKYCQIDNNLLFNSLFSKNKKMAHEQPRRDP